MNGRVLGAWGVPNWWPTWLRTYDEVRAEHADALVKLVGHVLTGLWIPWDTDAQERLGDLPVVVRTDGRQLEVCAAGIDQFSITWDTIDVGVPFKASSPWSVPITWHRLDGALPVRAQHRRVKAAALLEETVDWTEEPSGAVSTTRHCLGLGLEVAGTPDLWIMNGFDEVQLAAEAPWTTGIRLDYLR